MPLDQRGEAVGLLVVASATDHGFTEADVEIAAALAEQGMVAYETACLFDQVRELAAKDGLTGIYNRRYLVELAGQRLTAAHAEAKEFAALMIDIDHFKKTNDRYGHAVGDEVIREIAIRLRTALRDGDLVGRYGGEEFAYFTHGDDAGEQAERLRVSVASIPVVSAAGPVQVTISLGVAALQASDATLDALLIRADSALYEAKRQGRDRVFQHPS